MIRNYFTYGDFISSDAGLYISGGGTFNSPERDYKANTVLGRDGDLIIDNGRFKNVSVRYNAFMTSGGNPFAVKAEYVRRELLRQTKYQRLADTYHPDEFRLGIYSGRIDFDMSQLNREGRTTLSFNCKPQRFLISGEKEIAIGTSGNVFNPTVFASKPLIKLTCNGSGSVSVRGESGTTYTVAIAEVYGTFYIDCDLMIAYSHVNGVYENLNPHIAVNTTGFPVLEAGASEVFAMNDVSNVSIIGRWWTI